MQIGFVFGPVIWKDHGLLLIVEFEAHVGVKQDAQRAQEALHISQQLFGLQQHDNDQRALCQLRRLVAGAVQTVPAARLGVAALVAVAVLEVVTAVFVVPAEEVTYTKIKLHQCHIWLFLIAILV